jgi:cell division septum initiation protein DivIVA
MVYSCRVRFFFPNISALASYDRNADFAFIDEARTALPAALAEIERLRRRNAYLEKYVGSTVPSKAQAALAEVERLRARLAGAADAAQGISLPTFDDERLRYVEVQIDREDLEVLRRLDIELFGIDPESVRAAEAELDRGERVTPEEIEEESDGD